MQVKTAVSEVITKGTMSARLYSYFLCRSLNLQPTF